MRFLLHAPLQLASVLFAASSTSEVCGRFFASNTGLGCMGAVSLMQLSLGVFIPGIMCHLLDMRSTGELRAGRRGQGEQRSACCPIKGGSMGMEVAPCAVLCGLGLAALPTRFACPLPACLQTSHTSRTSRPSAGCSSPDQGSRLASGLLPPALLTACARMPPPGSPPSRSGAASWLYPLL